MFETFGEYGFTLRLRLKDRALQRRNQEARELIAFSLPRHLANLHRSQAIRDRLAHLLIYFHQPLPGHFAVLARFGAEVADQTAVPPTDPIKILDLRLDEGAQALKRRNRSLRRVRRIISGRTPPIRNRPPDGAGARVRLSRRLDDVADAAGWRPTFAFRLGFPIRPAPPRPRRDPKSVIFTAGCA